MSAASSRIRIGVTRPGFSLNVDLEIPATGITVLFGASGSGKTTVLRCVAGLERACQGLVRIGEHVWQDDAAHTFLATWRRPLGYVFQEASLFEHLTVSENMRYGLKRAGSPDAGQALDAAIRLLGVEDLQRRMPAQLSGGALRLTYCSFLCELGDLGFSMVGLETMERAKKTDTPAAEPPAPEPAGAR